MNLAAKFRDAPIGRKLMLVGLLTTALALFSVSLILVARGWVDWREKTLAEMENYAALIGANAAPSIIFGDYDAAAEVLRTLGENSDIVDVVLYDKDGKVFARYRAPMHLEGNMPLVELGSYLFSFDQLVVTKPVMLKGEVWGSVYLESDLRGLYAAITRQALLTFIAAAGVFLVALLLFYRLQRAIVSPIASLSSVMRKVSAERDYAMRAQVQGKDEVGALAGAFNDMLAQIQARDEALARHSEHLEQVVAQRTAKLTEAQRIAHLGNGEWDIASNTMNWSEEIYRIFGRTPTQLGSTFKDFLKVVHPEDRKLVEDGVRKALEQPRPFSMDHRILLPDGTVRYVHDEIEVIGGEDGRPVRMVGTVQDVTERKIAARSLEASERKLRAVLDAAVDGILVADADTNRFVLGNRAICDMLGYRQDEIGPLGISDIHPAEALEEVKRQFARQMRGEIRVAPNLAVKRKDGSVFFADISSSPMEIAGRHYLVGIFHDVTERKQAEEVLQVSRLRYESLFESSRDALMTLAPPSWKFVSANQATLQLFGASSVAEFTGLGPWNVSPERQPDGRLSSEKAQAMIAIAMSEGVNLFEWEHQRLGGSPFAAEVLLTRIELGKEQFLQATVRDITERKRAEETVKQLRRELEMILEAAGEGICTMDANGNHVLVNPAAARMFGYEAEEMVGRDSHGLWHYAKADGSPYPEEECPIYATMRDGVHHRSESEVFWRKDGSSFPVEYVSTPIWSNVVITGTVVVFRDITERRRAEAERRRLSEAVEQSMEAIVLTDTGRSILYVNPSFTRLFGYSAQEVVGQSVDLLAVEGYPAPSQTAEIALAQGAYSGETMRRGKDGKAILVLLNVATVRDEHNEISGYVGTMTDLTELKRAEMEARQRMVELTQANAELQELNAKLAQAQIQLVQSEKMASIGMLAAGVAHEINNPIGYIRSNLGALDNYIGNFLDLLDAYEKVERSMPDRSESFAGLDALKGKVDLSYVKGDVVALLHESHEGVDRVTKIVQDLKDFSRVETEEQWTSENIHHGIDSTLNVIWNELKYKCEVVKEYGELPNIDCLPSQLNQVFMNMLVNAAQAIEVRGRITIRTGQEGERVWVAISDTGQGIPPENIPHLFDPFFTTKPVGKGTGLGLSVSYNIVEKHHGKIEVQSEVGKGTTFRVWLPILQQAIKENA